jgi:hypothetical protein
MVTSLAFRMLRPRYRKASVAAKSFRIAPAIDRQIAFPLAAGNA